MTRRRAWLLVHRVNGLLLAAFLTVVGATGSLLAWRAQLERTFAPQLFVLPQHPEGALRLDPVVVRDKVAAAFPWANVNTLDLSAEPGDPLEFYLDRKAGVPGRPLDDEAYVDPYSGQVLGSRRYGDLRQGWKNFLPFVYTLHEDLALGEFGITLLGIAALLWTVDCFVGLYLSFPASKRSVVPSFGRRAVGWPARWSASWRIRSRASGYQRLYDLHRASGVWLWVMLLVFAWTGVAFNLPAVYGPVMRVFGAEKPLQLPIENCRPSEAIHWAGVLRSARDSMARESKGRGFDIRSERFLSYEPSQCEWTYRVRSTLDVDRIGNTQLRWSDDRLQGAIFTSPTGRTAADTFTTIIEAMHEAQIGGYGFRVVVCLGGIVTALLSVTGVMIFLRKLRWP